MSKLSIEQIIESIKQYSLSELNHLVKCIELEFSISTNFTVEPPPESHSDSEASEADLHLTNAGSNKMAVIRLIREITALSLIDAKKIADTAPSLVKKDIPSIEIDELKKKFTDIGATIEFR